VERHAGAASVFHARPLPDPVGPAVWVLTVDRPALVLGSAEPEGHADVDALAAAGVELVRRRSGGGAVLLRPGESTWVDLLLPARHPLWVDDVGRATHWVGEAWAAALRALGLDAHAHTGSMVHRPWSDRVCFAGLGPGEVLDGRGRKLVGLSQRRTRAGARFQTALHHRWDPGGTAAALALDDHDRARLVADLADAVAPVPHPAGVVVASLLEQLPHAAGR
jgi:lipoate-protein ligase A